MTAAARPGVPTRHANSPAGSIVLIAYFLLAGMMPAFGQSDTIDERAEDTTGATPLTEWIHAIDDRWEEPGNWSLGVPDAETDALITTTGPRPLIDAVSAVARDVYINGKAYGVALRIQNGGSLDCRNLAWAALPDALVNLEVNGSGSRLSASGDIDILVPGKAGVTDVLHSLLVQDGARLEAGGTVRAGSSEMITGTSNLVFGILRLAGSGSTAVIDTLDAGRWSHGQVDVQGTSQLTVLSRMEIGSNHSVNQRPTYINLTGSSSQPQIEMSLDSDGIVGRDGLLTRFILSNNAPVNYLRNSAGHPLPLSGGLRIRHVSQTTTVLEGTHPVTGLTEVEFGTLVVDGAIPGSNATVSFGAQLRGSGTIGTTINAGTVRPGHTEPGTLTVEGNYTQEGSGTLELRIRPDGGYDALQINGVANVEGRTLVVRVEEGEHQPTDWFDLLSASSGLNGPPTIVEENESDLVLEVQALNTSIRARLVSTGNLSVTPDPLDFGQVANGAATTDMVTLENSGQSVLAIFEVDSATAPFSRLGGSCPENFGFILSPGQTCTIEFGFSPMLTGQTNQTLSISHDGPGLVYELLLTGKGQGTAIDPVFRDRFEPSPLP